YDLLHVERFADEIECALAHRFDRGFERAETADENHLACGRGLPEMFEQGDPIERIIKIDIADDQIELPRFNQSKRGRNVGRSSHLPALILENLSKETASV